MQNKRKRWIEVRINKANAHNEIQKGSKSHITQISYKKLIKYMRRKNRGRGRGRIEVREDKYNTILVTM